jgi:hypothetical protein
MVRITISCPNRPALSADVDFPPRPGEMVVIGHDYYRVDSLTWTCNAEVGVLGVRVVVVDMYETKRWHGWAYVVLYSLATIGVAALVTRCVAGLG